MDRSSGRILLVEAHSDIREALGLLMESVGHTVIPAASAEEGLAKLSTQEVDLVITDDVLPGRTGVALLREAVRRGLIAPAQALIITAKEQVDDAREFLVLRKPMELDQLLGEISRRLNRMASGARPQVPATVELALYITAGSVRSQGAVRALEDILSACDPMSFRFELRDLSTGFRMEAEEDGISFTPTLVKRSPGARSWFVGDFQDVAKVSRQLGIWGILKREH